MGLQRRAQNSPSVYSFLDFYSVAKLCWTFSLLRRGPKSAGLRRPQRTSRTKSMFEVLGFGELHCLNNAASQRMDFVLAGTSLNRFLSRHLCVVFGALNCSLHEQAQDVNVFTAAAAAASDRRPLGTISADGLERIHERWIYWQHQSAKADFLPSNIQYPKHFFSLKR